MKCQHGQGGGSAAGLQAGQGPVLAQGLRRHTANYHIIEVCEMRLQSRERA